MFSNNKKSRNLILTAKPGEYVLTLHPEIFRVARNAGKTLRGFHPWTVRFPLIPFPRWLG